MNWRDVLRSAGHRILDALELIARGAPPEDRWYCRDCKHCPFTERGTYGVSSKPRTCDGCGMKAICYQFERLSL